jgi:hypothetical protein
MTHQAQQSKGLQPAEAFFDTLPLLLADPIAHVPRRSAVDGTAASASQISGHMGRHPQVPALAHKIGGVEIFVTARGHATDDLRVAISSAALPQHSFIAEPESAFQVKNASAWARS